MTKYPPVNCQSFNDDYGTSLKFFAYTEYEKNKGLDKTAYVGYLQCFCT